MEIPSTTTAVWLCFIITVIPVILGIDNVNNDTKAQWAILTGNFYKILKEGKAAFTSTQGETYVNELIPLVEKASGRKFKHVPKIKIASRDEVAESLAQDFEVKYKNNMLGWSSKRRTEAAQAFAEFRVPLLLANYGHSNKTLYLLPRNIMLLLKSCEIDTKYTQSIVRLVIAHELTHALQDQTINLSQKLIGMESENEVRVFEICFEGHSLFVQDQVGKMLEIDREVIETAILFATGNFKFKSPNLESLNKALAKLYESAYLGSNKLMEYHYYKLDGTEMFWQALSSPHHGDRVIAMINGIIATHACRNVGTFVRREHKKGGLATRFHIMNDNLHWYTKDFEYRIPLKMLKKEVAVVPDETSFRGGKKIVNTVRLEMLPLDSKSLWYDVKKNEYVDIPIYPSIYFLKEDEEIAHLLTNALESLIASRDLDSEE
jgi:hypothetical protein